MKKHVSYRGQVVDMELLKHQNQHAVAIGNLSMNARGDILGRGGVIVKTREEQLAEKERELQKPDFNPVQHSNSQAPEMDDGFDDNAFEPPKQSSASDFVEDAPAPKRAPRKQEK